MKRKIYPIIIGVTLAITGCTTVQLGDGTTLTTIGGTRSLSGLVYSNQTYGISISLSGYQGNQSEDVQAAMTLLAQAMAVMAKGAASAP